MSDPNPVPRDTERIADEQLSYEQRAAAATEAVRQLTSYFKARK